MSTYTVRHDHPSHHFAWGDEDYRCWNCDCRPAGIWGVLPCGLDESDLAAVIASVPEVADRYDASDWLYAALSAYDPELENS